MICNIQGHPDYEISTLSSGEVTAAILTIGRFDAASLPFTAEAILTTVDGATQYQIKVRYIVAWHNTLIMCFA